MTPPSLSRQPPTTVARPKASVRVLLELRQNPERLEKEAKAVVNVSKGHRRRRELISLQFDAANSKALVLLRAWQKCMGPGSALSYAMTLAGMHPYIRTDPQVRVVLDAMRQSASLGASRRAMLITPEWVRALLATASSTVAATAWFMWLSTCRHADLQYIHQFGTAPGYLVVRWDRFKSDRYGRRAVSRFITVLKSQEKFVKDLPRWCTYRQLLDALKKVNPELSTYSLRRGGASFLADAGNSNANGGPDDSPHPDSGSSPGSQEVRGPVGQPAGGQGSVEDVATTGDGTGAGLEAAARCDADRQRYVAMLDAAVVNISEVRVPFPGRSFLGPQPPHPIDVQRRAKIGPFRCRGTSTIFFSHRKKSPT